MSVTTESPAYEWIKAEGIEKGIEKGKLEGREEGREEGKLEDAKKMLAKGYSIADISDITSLSTKELERLM